jgi:hypothetical protein
MLMLRTVKDDLGLKVPGVYSVLCECREVYVGQTGRSIDVKCKEHMRHVCLNQLEKSVVAEQSINTGHHVDFNNISVLDRASGYMDHLIKKTIEIRVNYETFNRDSGFTLSWAWYPETNLLSNQKAGPGRAVT